MATLVLFVLLAGCGFAAGALLPLSGGAVAPGTVTAVLFLLLGGVPVRAFRQVKDGKYFSYDALMPVAVFGGMLGLLYVPVLVQLDGIMSGYGEYSREGAAFTQLFAFAVGAPLGVVLGLVLRAAVFLFLRAFALPRAAGPAPDAR